jgi:hypothetical protein
LKGCVVALALAWLIVFAGCASAEYAELGYGEHAVTSELGVNEDDAYVVHLRVGDRLSVDLEVTSGGLVDFFLTNVTAYMLYKASLSGEVHFNYLYYAADYSAKSVGSIGYDFTAFVEDTLVVVIDNTGWTEGGASPVGDVVVEGSIAVQKNVWTWQNIAITALVVGVIIAFMVGVKLPRRRS